MRSMTEGLPQHRVRFRRNQCEYDTFCCAIPPTRLRRATSLYTREALGQLFTLAYEPPYFFGGFFVFP